LLEKQHNVLREKARDFALKYLEPKALTLDLEQRFPTEHLKPLTDNGYLSLLIPKEYGGNKVDTISYSIIVEEFSRVCGSTGIIVAAHNSLGTGPIIYFGNDNQKKKFLPRAVKGELVSFGLTEPDAGSDAGGTKTIAMRQNNHWIVNGSKCWITSAPQAFATVATARTSQDASDKRITTFVFERAFKGYTVGKKENKLGLRGSDTAFLHFDDMHVPDENRLGEIGHGFKQMLVTLDGGRISIGAMALGLAQGALDVAIKYSADRIAFGQPISNNQAIQHKLATMATELEAARLLIYETAQMKDAGLDFTQFSAMCKLFASEVATRTCSTAMSILGAVGYYTGPYPVERMWRDVKLCEIGEGTSEIQRLVIARELLKKVKPA
jgi:alkylation response protein AidB-like acyl-CoA dehydrogenase